MQELHSLLQESCDADILGFCEHAHEHSLTAAPGLVSVVLAPLSSRRCFADAARRSRASRLLARCCAADIFSDSMLARSRCSKSQCPARWPGTGAITACRQLSCGLCGQCYHPADCLTRSSLALQHAAVQAPGDKQLTLHRLAFGRCEELAVLLLHLGIALLLCHLLLLQKAQQQLQVQTQRRQRPLGRSAICCHTTVGRRAACQPCYWPFGTKASVDHCSCTATACQCSTLLRV